jgi:hypothetical protein
MLYRTDEMLTNAGDYLDAVLVTARLADELHSNRMNVIFVNNQYIDEELVKEALYVTKKVMYFDEETKKTETGDAIELSFRVINKEIVVEGEFDDSDVFYNYLDTYKLEHSGYFLAKKLEHGTTKFLFKFGNEPVRFKFFIEDFVAPALTGKRMVRGFSKGVFHEMFGRSARGKSSLDYKGRILKNGKTI